MKLHIEVLADDKAEMIRNLERLVNEFLIPEIEDIKNVTEFETIRCYFESKTGHVDAHIMD